MDKRRILFFFHVSISVSFEYLSNREEKQNIFSLSLFMELDSLSSSRVRKREGQHTHIYRQTKEVILIDTVFFFEKMSSTNNC